MLQYFCCAFDLDVSGSVSQHRVMSMPSCRRLLFLQLPCLDNGVAACRENVYLAAGYLRFSMERTAEARHHEVVIPPQDTDLLDDSRLVKYIADLNPDVLCATLYLWNVERSLGVLGKLKLACGKLRIIVGGPEVSRDHPFLFTSGIPDVAVSGEGEPVFSAILNALRTGRRPALPATAWRYGTRYSWGPCRQVAARLVDLLPPPEHECNRPFAGGIGYLESGRGCPLRCAFCCYNQRRRTASYIDAGQVLRRVRVLRERGAREIRFVDPTFNSNPHFEEILAGLAAMNRRRQLRFFAELRAETVTGRQADLLASANFADIEVGVQSRDAAVLRVIRRPTVLSSLDRGIGLLSSRGIKLTVDVMCGLPGQGMPDLARSVRRAAKIRGARVQFLHTLLLPGTELRARKRALGLCGQDRPPYRVISTRVLSAADIVKAENMARRVTGSATDCPTKRFVGTRLPDLFPERVDVPVEKLRSPVPGGESRRAVIIRGDDLFSRRRMICGLVGRAIRSEPHALWQFVLSPSTEEPLDLLDAMIAEIDRFSPGYLDRTVVSPHGCGRRASRRVMILLRPGISYDKSWIRAADEFLSGKFY